MPHKLGVTIHNVLHIRASLYPSKKLYRFLQADSQESCVWTYQEFAAKVNGLAQRFIENGLQGKRALLVFSDGPDFVLSFWACLEAGVVAVPIYPPRSARHAERLIKIVEDSAVDVLLTSTEDHRKLMRFKFTSSLEVEFFKIDHQAVVAQQERSNALAQNIDDVAFIQYTSGSTADPKGVIITHRNLMHNQEMIKQGFGGGEDSVIVSWLPFYHDMGLIGNILHGAFLGGEVILMSPFHFIQQPLRWFHAIDRYKATHSGGPNFAYQRCEEQIKLEDLTNIDLSSWKVAYNGSEPVRAETMKQFTNRFSRVGFSAQAFAPCYGLAEATLLVTCKGEGEYQTLSVDKKAFEAGNVSIESTGAQSVELISSGVVNQEVDLKIIQPNGEVLCDTNEIGEICIAGASVTSGYWNKDNRKHFVTIAAIDESSKSYFRTGDLGVIDNGALYVTGRAKEMLIIRGRNLYPYDIEYHVSGCHPALEGGAVAAFGIQHSQEEVLVLAVEMNRSQVRNPDVQSIYQAVEKAASEVLDVTFFDIVLLQPLGIPRTSSGKLQRVKCSLLYKAEAWANHPRLLGNVTSTNIADDATISRHAQRLVDQPESDNAQLFLHAVLESKLGKNMRWDGTASILELGLDSIKAMELVNTINQELQLNIEIKTLLEQNDLTHLVSTVTSSLWLRVPVSTEEDGEELIL
jgi:acyl-CoA synthetase (AMP-forming)/AMP-acid ligase II/aryl carrier-like protein